MIIYNNSQKPPRVGSECDKLVLLHERTNSAYMTAYQLNETAGRMRQKSLTNHSEAKLVKNIAYLLMMSLATGSYDITPLTIYILTSSPEQSNLLLRPVTVRPTLSKTTSPI